MSYIFLPVCVFLLTHFTFWRRHHCASFGTSEHGAKKKREMLRWNTLCDNCFLPISPDSTCAPAEKAPWATASYTAASVLWMCNLSLTRPCMRKDTKVYVCCVTLLKSQPMMRAQLSNLMKRFKQRALSRREWRME